MFIYVLPYQNQYIVYRPLKRLAFLANAALINLISALSTRPSAPFLEEHSEACHFLNSLGFWESEPELPETSPFEQAFNPTVAVLFLTTACNFRCSYCYAMGGEQKTEYLPVELAYRAIDQVYHNAMEMGQDHFELAFHGGGEPTLAKNNFRALVEYARAKSIAAKISITSNGFWDEEERNWILEHVDNVSLSFDGIQEVQDVQRPLSSGEGTFATLLDTIRTMDARQFPYGIRLTVVDTSIEFLGQSIEFLCKESSCRTFQIEPAFKHGRAERDATALTHNQRFASAFMQAYEIAASYERHLYYSGARPWVLSTRFCQAPERALVVTPDGSLTTCYEMYSADHALSQNFYVGKLSDTGEVDIDIASRRRFFEKLQERRKLCKDCFCYWHCAGDCPSKTFSTGEDGHLFFGDRCELNRVITQELLIRNIANGNGIWQG